LVGSSLALTMFRSPGSIGADVGRWQPRALACLLGQFVNRPCNTCSQRVAAEVPYHLFLSPVLSVPVYISARSFIPAKSLLFTPVFPKTALPNSEVRITLVTTRGNLHARAKRKTLRPTESPWVTVRYSGQGPPPAGPAGS
jgi:hypothetical protein